MEMGFDMVKCKTATTEKAAAGQRDRSPVPWNDRVLIRYVFGASEMGS